MSEISEAIEKAQEGEHGEGFNRKIALVIAILALFLSFSETLGKGAQTEVVTKNIEASDLWAFFQAKDIRRTVVSVAADQTGLLAAGVTDAAAKAAIDKQIETWRQTAERYESDPKAGNGRKELEEQAKEAEGERDLVDGEIPSLRIGVGCVSDRHRAGIGSRDHRHGGARLAGRRARRRRVSRSWRSGCSRRMRCRSSRRCEFNPSS